jgi:hypothetical protein
VRRRSFFVDLGIIARTIATIVLRKPPRALDALDDSNSVA